MNGLPYPNSCPYAPPKLSGTRHHNHFLLKTPTVIQYTRSEFNCHTAEGLELDKNIGHWPERIMFDEIMAAGPQDVPRFVSKLTLAAFQDSGWYNVKITHGLNVTFG